MRAISSILTPLDRRMNTLRFSGSNRASSGQMPRHGLSLPHSLLCPIEWRPNRLHHHSHLLVPPAIVPDPVNTGVLGDRAQPTHELPSCLAVIAPNVSIRIEERILRDVFRLHNVPVECGTANPPDRLVKVVIQLIERGPVASAGPNRQSLNFVVAELRIRRRNSPAYRPRPLLPARMPNPKLGVRFYTSLWWTKRWKHRRERLKERPRQRGAPVISRQAAPSVKAPAARMGWAPTVAEEAQPRRSGPTQTPSRTGGDELRLGRQDRRCRSLYCWRRCVGSERFAPEKKIRPRAARPGWPASPCAGHPGSMRPAKLPARAARPGPRPSLS